MLFNKSWIKLTEVFDNKMFITLVLTMFDRVNRINFKVGNVGLLNIIY